MGIEFDTGSALVVGVGGIVIAWLAYRAGVRSHESTVRVEAQTLSDAAKRMLDELGDERARLLTWYEHLYAAQGRFYSGAMEVTVDNDRFRERLETLEILQTLLRCVSMKRALKADARETLNFFAIYDGCLMDVSVISWCKVFGAYGEDAHWTNLFSADSHQQIRRDLHKVAGGKMQFATIHKEATDYRNMSVAHHSFDEVVRPKRHPFLDPLWSTGLVLYERLYRWLQDDGCPAWRMPAALHRLSGDRLIALEEHWASIVGAVRQAVSRFGDRPEQDSIDPRHQVLDSR